MIQCYSDEVFQVCRNASCDAPVLENKAPVTTITLHASFSWVEPLQSGHALLLISPSAGCEGRINVGFVKSDQAVKTMESRKNI